MNTYRHTKRKVILIHHGQHVALTFEGKVRRGVVHRIEHDRVVVQLEPKLFVRVLKHRLEVLTDGDLFS